MKARRSTPTSLLFAPRRMPNGDWEIILPPKAARRAHRDIDRAQQGKRFRYWQRMWRAGSWDPPEPA